MTQKPNKHNLLLWGCAAIILIGSCIVILTTGGGAAYVYLNPTTASTITNTPTLDYTATQQAHINAALTAQAPLTQTAVIKTATYQAHMDAIATRYAEKTAAAQVYQVALAHFLEELGEQHYPDFSFLDPPIFGPHNRSIDHEEDYYFETYSSGVNLNNFVTKIVFQVPYASSRGSWDIGFLFRRSRSPRKHFFLVFDTYQHWELWLLNNGAYIDIDSGSIRLNTLLGQTNEILLVAYDNEGWLFLNGDFIAFLDLSDWTGAGDILPATGLLGNEIPGETTRFTDFTVWRIP